MLVLRLLRFSGGFLLAAAVIAVLIAAFPPKDPLPIGLPLGSVEFLIVANQVDDGEAIAATQELFEVIAADPKRRAELQKLAKEGKPPPVPNGKYRMMNSEASYQWVEIEPVSVANMFPEINPGYILYRKEIEESRDEGHVVILNKQCVWSRKCENTSLTEAERAQKRFDWFLLLREPNPGDELTERHLADIRAGKDVWQGRPIVSMKMTREGARRMERLTRDNLPSPSYFKRNLAIVIEGKIISFPGIESKLSDYAQISGEFDEAYVNDLVNRVRSAGK